MSRMVTMILSAALFSGVGVALPAVAQEKHGAIHGAHQRAEHVHGEARVGRPGEPGKVNRTLQVVMHDNMRFSPQSITVKRGEVIQFNVTNAGQLKHEMVIGSMAELQEHAKLMRKFPEMEHAEPNQVTLEPGKTGVIIWQFDVAGTVDFACLQPGHFEAGMKGVVNVAGK